MSSVAASAKPSQIKTIGFWVLKIFLSLIYFGAGTVKLIGVPMMVAEFGVVGLGQWFRYFTGTLEISGAILLLLPAFTGFGAIFLSLVTLGAFFAQALVLHMDVIHTIVLSLVLWAIVWSQREQIRARLFG